MCSTHFLHLIMGFVVPTMLGFFSYWNWSVYLPKRTQRSTPPKTKSSPLKIGYPKRKLVFQPSIFRGYVSFREGIEIVLFTRYLLWTCLPKHTTKVIHKLGISNHAFASKKKCRKIPHTNQDQNTLLQHGDTHPVFSPWIQQKSMPFMPSMEIMSL